jgi:multidrug efflux pump subunit AcrA (membrane-fusion protein)
VAKTIRHGRSAIVLLAVGLPRRGDVRGLTEPFRVVNVATTETGVVSTVTPREGDAVRKGEVLATDNDLHLTVLAIAASR